MGDHFCLHCGVSKPQLYVLTVAMFPSLGCVVTAAGRGFDAKGNPLHIETAHSHDGTHHSTAGTGPTAGIASQSALVVPTSTTSVTNPAVPRTSPFGGTKSPHFAPNLIIEVPPPSGTNHTPGVALADGSAANGDDMEISPLQDSEHEGSFDRPRTERSDSGVDGEAVITPISSGSDGPGASGSGGGGGGPGGNVGAGGAGGGSGMPGKPSLLRSVSHNASVESYRQTIMEMISQIRCVSGLAVCQSLFSCLSSC